MTAASGAAQSVAWQALGDVGFDPSEIGPARRRVERRRSPPGRARGRARGAPAALVLDEPFAGLDDRARRPQRGAQRLRGRARHDARVRVARPRPSRRARRSRGRADRRPDHLRRPRPRARSGRRPREPAVTRPVRHRRPPRPQAASRSPTFLRLVPGDSPVHRLWAGTKLIVAAELALIRLDRAVVAHARRARRSSCHRPAGRADPARRVPASPRVFYLLLLFGLFLNALATTPTGRAPRPVAGQPRRAQRSRPVPPARVVLIMSAALVGWTTPLGAVAPALARLARPLRAAAPRRRVDRRDRARVAVPAAARRRDAHVRRRPAAPASPSPSTEAVRGAVIELHDLVSTAIIVSLRRAHDLADAITARGGIGAVGDGHDGAFGWLDGDPPSASPRSWSRCSSSHDADAGGCEAGVQAGAFAMSSSTSAMCVINARCPSPGHVVSCALGSRSTSAVVCASGTSVSAVPCQQCTGTVILPRATCHGRARSVVGHRARRAAGERLREQREGASRGVPRSWSTLPVGLGHLGLPSATRCFGATRARCRRCATRRGRRPVRATPAT